MQDAIYKASMEGSDGKINVVSSDAGLGGDVTPVAGQKGLGGAVERMKGIESDIGKIISESKDNLEDIKNSDIGKLVYEWKRAKQNQDSNFDMNKPVEITDGTNTWYMDGDTITDTMPDNWDEDPGDTIDVTPTGTEPGVGTEPMV